MVEAVVSFAVQRLGNLLIREAVFLNGVHEQVDRLQKELRRMQCFLQDAEAKQVTNESVRNWVAEVRDVAYDSEDVIDTFILKVEFERREGFLGVLKSYASIFNKGVHLHEVGMEIQSILIRIQDISRSRLTYGIANVGEGLLNERERLQKQLRESHPHIDDEDVTGLEDNIQTLVSELIKEEEQLCVISIVGVGGLGKTTLAKKVYKHDVVKRHFDCFGWTSVSQQCSRSDVLHDILRNASTDQEMEATRNMNDKHLVEKLYLLLQNKRYFVVLDDIWSSEAWDILCPAFPNGKKGSKILITTRNKEVALHADPHSLHFEPRYLTGDESWILLYKKAFPKNVADRNCPLADFEKLGREMVGKCGGLPLGVVVLGGLLATKGALINEWEVVSKNINSHMNKGQKGVSTILALSYIDLPSHLKPCFLYLAFFPEDSDISRKKLVHLWVAEGFIKQQEKGQATMEEVGEEQLAELTQRCMVQIGRKCRASGRIKTCRMHDLMRDLCLLKARQEGFLDIFVDHHEKVAADSSSYNRLRRYAIHNNTEETRYVSLKSITTTSHLRSLMILDSNMNVKIDTSFLKGCYRNIKLIRVLDLQGTGFHGDHVEHAAKQIGKLIHLVYLGMAVMEHRKVSPSIGNLKSLQTLNLRNLHVSLPNTMGKMEQLRHFYLNRCSTNICSLQISTWTNIRTLKWIDAGKWIGGGGLEKMTSLRKLGILELTTSQARVVLASSIIVNSSSSSSSFDSSSSNLRSLSLDMHWGNSFPNLLVALSDCHHLLKLSLEGLIETLPRFSPNLTKLTLIRSELKKDPMERLEDLPNLKYLKLGWSSYVGHEMVCSLKGFPRLQFLSLEGLGFRVWRVIQGAMPHLNCLTISFCKMEMVPEGLRFVTTLRELDIKSMPGKFKLRVVSGAEDWYKVQHIPSIKIQ